MAHSTLTVVSPGISSTQLLTRQVRQLRLAMQEAIQYERWPTVSRIDRLCGQAMESLTPSLVNRELAVEILRIRELYRNLVSDINRRLTHSVQAQ